MPRLVLFASVVFFIVPLLGQHINAQTMVECFKKPILCNGEPSTVKVLELTPLARNFIILSDSQRKLLQSSLADLGLYKASIDGIYGRGASTALKAYNEKYLGDSDLTESSNVKRLILNLVYAIPPKRMFKPD